MTTKIIDKKEKKKIENTSYLGVDVGNGYVKSRNVKFASRIEVGSRIGFGKVNKNVHSVIYDGVSYQVGKGSAFTGTERYTTKEYKIAFLTAIALNFPKETFIEGTFCLGLPLELYKAYNEVLINEFNGKQFNITVEDREVTIRVKDITVYVEGAYPVILNSDKRILTIDMGAGTVNVSQFFNQEVELYATYDKAMYNLYAEISQYLNVNKGSRYMPTDIEKILNKDKVMINQKEVDITDIKPLIRGAINSIASLINTRFAVKDVEEVYLMGGGSLDTSKYWLEHFPTAKIVEDGQTINAKIFDAMALYLAEDNEE